MMRLFFTKYLVIPFMMIGVMSIGYAQILINRTQGNISFITGGITEDESTAMKLMSKKWPLSIEFSEYSGGKDLWIAQVYLRILDTNGKTLFDTKIDGPMFLGRLPLGNYKLLATYKGVTQSRKIQIIDGKPLHVSMNWRLSKSRV